jgi:hypothetical protein
MGDGLRTEVELQLLADLRHYGRFPAGLWVDWSDACQEGHMTSCLGGTLEVLSGLVVRDASQVAVAEGWMDFIHGSADAPLFVFWLFLFVLRDDSRTRVKTDNAIPEHLWRMLPEATKSLCATDGGYDARWAKDPRVVAWRQRNTNA